MTEQTMQAVQPEQSPELRVSIADSLPNAVIPGSLPAMPLPTVAAPQAVVSKPQHNEKALIFLMDANTVALAATQTVKDDVFNAAAECDTRNEWVATVAVLRANLRDAKTELDTTLGQYIARVSKGWEERNDRAKIVQDCYSVLKDCGQDMDPFEGIKARASGTEFLLPSSNEYKTAAQYFRDLNMVADMQAKKKAALQAKSKATAAAEKVAANIAKAAGKDGGTVTPTGETRQTGELSEALQNALNRVIRAVHSHSQDIPEALLIASLDACEARISVDIPAELKVPMIVAAGKAADAAKDAEGTQPAEMPVIAPEASERLADIATASAAVVAHKRKRR